MTDACTLILGAGGRVGRLLRGIWHVETDATPVLFQSRGAGPGIDLRHPLGPKLAACTPRTVEHVVVLSGVTTADRPDGFDGNVTLARSALTLARELGAKTVTLASTAAVYPGGHHEWRETDKVTPRGAYATSKHAMEDAAVNWHAMHGGPNILCLRLANIVGADMLGDAVRAARYGHSLCLDTFDDGSTPARAYLSPFTFARLLAAITRHGAPKGVTIYNVAEPGGSVQMGDLISLKTSAEPRLTTSRRDAPPMALRDMRLNTEAVQGRFPTVFQGYISAARLVADWQAAERSAP